MEATTEDDSNESITSKYDTTTVRNITLSIADMTTDSPFQPIATLSTSPHKKFLDIHEARQKL
jgi:hypothetical protein